MDEINRREKPSESHAARSITKEEISKVHGIRGNVLHTSGSGEEMDSLGILVKTPESYRLIIAHL